MKGEAIIKIGVVPSNHGVVYESDFLDLDRISAPDTTTGIRNIGQEENGLSGAEKEIYSINGEKLGTSLEDLVPGIYIVRSGKAVKKIMVK